MQIRDYIDDNNIKVLLMDWYKVNKREISPLKKKEYEEVFAHIYSFELVLIQIDEIITNKENAKKSEPTTVTFNSKEFKFTVEDEHFEVFTNKWKNLSDIGLNSAERKELNIQLEDYLKLKYARYMGFIKGVLQMFKVSESE